MFFSFPISQIEPRNSGGKNNGVCLVQIESRRTRENYMFCPIHKCQLQGKFESISQTFSGTFKCPSCPQGYSSTNLATFFFFFNKTIGTCCKFYGSDMEVCEDYDEPVNGKRKRKESPFLVTNQVSFFFLLSKIRNTLFNFSLFSIVDFWLNVGKSRVRSVRTLL